MGVDTLDESGSNSGVELEKKSLSPETGPKKPELPSRGRLPWLALCFRRLVMSFLLLRILECVSACR